MLRIRKYPPTNPKLLRDAQDTMYCVMSFSFTASYFFYGHDHVFATTVKYQPVISTGPRLFTQKLSLFLQIKKKTLFFKEILAISHTDRNSMDTVVQLFPNHTVMQLFPNHTVTQLFPNHIISIIGDYFLASKISWFFGV